MAWLSGYSKRKKITLTGGSSGAQTDYQVKLAVTYDSDMQADFDDLRFTKSNGTTLLDAWLESKTDSTSAVVWVETDTPANTAEADIYMYYGNGSAASYWDICGTMLSGDDFSKPLADPKYVVTEETGCFESYGFTVKLSNGNLMHIYTTGAGHDYDANRAIVKRVSTDGGVTWGTENSIYTDSYDDRNLAGGMSSTGAIIIFMSRYDGTDHKYISFIRSTDNGATWSSITNITDSDITHCNSPHGALVEVTGKGLMISYYICDSPYKQKVVWSTNDGVTWGSVQTVWAPATMYSECAYQYVGNKRIMGWIRDDISPHNIHQVTSDDDGATWSNAATGMIEHSGPMAAQYFTHNGIDKVFLVYMDAVTPKLMYRIAEVSDVFSDATKWQNVDEILLDEDGLYQTVHYDDSYPIFKVVYQNNSDYHLDIKFVDVAHNNWGTLLGSPTVSGGNLSLPAVSEIYINSSRARPIAFRMKVNLNTSRYFRGGFTIATSANWNTHGVYFQPYTSGKLLPTNYSSSSYTQDGTSAYTSGDRILEATWETDECKYYYEDSLIATHTTNVPTVDLYLKLRADIGTTTVDWVFIRKYVANPATYAFGGEQFQASIGYTSDALFKKLGLTKTYTSDALLKKEGATVTYSADALLKIQNILKSYTSDLLIKLVDRDVTYSADVLLELDGITKAYSSDLLIAVQQSKAYTTDALLKALGLSTSYTADALLKLIDESKTYTVDSLIKKVDAGIPYTSDALLKKEGVDATYTVDLLIQEIDKTLSYTADLIIQLIATKTYTADALLKKLNNTSSYTADLIIVTNPLRELSTTIVTTTTLSQIDLITATLRELTTTIATTTGTGTPELLIFRELTATLAAQTDSSASMDVVREIVSTIASVTTLSEIELILATLRELSTTITAGTITSEGALDVLREIAATVSTQTGSAATLLILRELQSAIAAGTTLSDIELLIGALRELAATIAITTSTSASALDVLRELQATVAAGTALSQIDLITATLRELATTVAVSTTTSTPSLDVLREIVSAISASTLTSTAQLNILRELTATIATTTTLSQIELITAILRELSTTIATTAATSTADVVVLRELISSMDAQSASAASLNLLREIQAVVAAGTTLSQIDLLVGSLRELATTIATSTASAGSLNVTRDFTTTISADTNTSDIAIRMVRAMSAQIAAGTDAGAATLQVLRQISATINAETATSAIELVVAAAVLLVDTEIQSLTPLRTIQET